MPDIRKPITFEELKVEAQGTLVELPPFVTGKRFFARMCQPSLTSLFMAGKIPNVLLEEVRKVFRQPKPGGDIVIDADNLDNETTTNFMEVTEILAKEAFLEPTWQEIKDSGVQLTEAQYLFIFQFTQGEVMNLTGFREQREVHSGTVDGETVQVQTVGDNGDKE